MDVRDREARCERSKVKRVKTRSSDLELERRREGRRRRTCMQLDLAAVRHRFEARTDAKPRSHDRVQATQTATLALSKSRSPIQDASARFRSLHCNTRMQLAIPFHNTATRGEVTRACLQSGLTRGEVQGGARTDRVFASPRSKSETRAGEILTLRFYSAKKEHLQGSRGGQVKQPRSTLPPPGPTAQPLLPLRS